MNSLAANHAWPKSHPLSISPRFCKYGGVALIAIAITVAYWPALHGGFIFDDEILITYNPIIKAPDGLYRFWFTKEALDYWPISNSVLWMEWRLWKLDPTGYHVVNLLLHIADSLLMWILLRKLHVPGAFLAALLFAVHPVNVESVAWIAQCKNVLALFFFLLSILWWLKAYERCGKNDANHEAANKQTPIDTMHLSINGSIFNLWYWLSLAAFICAMLSKGSVVFLPLVLLLIVWWQANQITYQNVIQCLPFFVVALTLTIVNLWFRTHGASSVIRDVTPIQRVLGAGAVIWFYLSKSLVPVDLLFIYPQWNIQSTDPRWWLPLFAALTTTTLLLYLRNSRWAYWVRSILFAWAFFCLCLLPVMGFTDVGFMYHSLVADHYEHIALIGVVALFASALSYGYEKHYEPFRKAIVIVAAIVVTTFIHLSSQQSSLYANALILYQDLVNKNPNSWLVQSNLGLELSRHGDFEEAIPHFSAALRLNPFCAVAHLHWGNALVDLNQPKEAIEHYRQAIKIVPEYSEAHYRLGLAFQFLDHPAEAEQEYQKALEFDFANAEAHQSLGLILASHQQFPEAIDHFKEAVEINPDLVTAYINLASASAAINHYIEAIQISQQALKLAQSQGDAKAAEGIIARLKFYQTRLPEPAQSSQDLKESH